MLISADQILAHLIGDYILQSDWQASQKTKDISAAALHAFVYGLPFAFLQPSVAAAFFIVLTHFVIDHWRLARYVVWLKNQAAPAEFRSRWSDCVATGYPSSRPPWMAVWLLIIADNTLHLLCNGVALRWL